MLDRGYGYQQQALTEVFTESTIKGKLGVNAMKAYKHL
jgi:hypothetical protein